MKNIHYAFILSVLSMTLGFFGYTTTISSQTDVQKNSNEGSSKLNREPLQIRYIETFTLFSNASKDSMFGGFLLFGNDGLWEGKSVNGAYQLSNMAGIHDVRYYFGEIHSKQGIKRNISNSVISIEVKNEFLENGKELSGSGLMYRFDDKNKTYYAFIIHKEQIFSFYKRNKTGYVNLYSSRSELIKEDDYNKISIHGNESTFNLHINDQLVKTLTDPELKTGGTGLIAMSIGIYNFDNLWQPS